MKKITNCFKRLFAWYAKTYYEAYKPVIDAGLSPFI